MIRLPTLEDAREQAGLLKGRTVYIYRVRQHDGRDGYWLTLEPQIRANCEVELIEKVAVQAPHGRQAGGSASDPFVVKQNTVGNGYCT